MKGFATFVYPLVALGVAALVPGPSRAAPFTPLPWQTRIDRHAQPVFIGQLKHVSWSRDQNRNFIDDRLEVAALAGKPLNVIVDLNHCLPPERIAGLLGPFGHISYVGKLLSIVQLDQVAPADLPRLAALPEVAMVEERSLMNPEIDVASRAVQAHKTGAFPMATAEDMGLTGAGVVIAVQGTGMSSSTFTTLAGKRVAGFDATNPSDPGDGSTDPAPTSSHESIMGVIALGAAVPGQTCRNPGGADVPNCAGIAPGANYVNVSQCHLVSGTQTCDGFVKAADWIGINAKKFGIRIVIMAFSSCGDDDGTSAQAQEANYLVGIGLVVVASSSQNPANCTPAGAIGDRIVRAPGSGSYVLMVQAAADHGTVTRSDDGVWSNFTRGPRSDFNLMQLDLTALKPDLSAPGQELAMNPGGGGIDVVQSGTTHITGIAGASPATAIVAGLAALILEKYPAMTPDSVKQLLIDSADNTRNSPFGVMTAQWDSSLGWGFANVGKALQNAAANGTDLTFPNCAATGSVSGQPCALSNGQPNWNNSDINTSSPPRVNMATTLTANVTNRGTKAAMATVNFGIIIFSAGNNQFHHVGSQQITVQPGQTVQATVPWTPTTTDHTCAQVSIAFGEDSDYSNNLSQHNLAVGASSYVMEVNNTMLEPSHFEVIAKSRRAGWACAVDQVAFDLDAFVDCPRRVAISFRAPAHTPVGQRAQCDVAVFATPRAGKRIPVGGVSVITYVPKPCLVDGRVVGTDGQPLAGASIRLTATEAEHAGTAAVTRSDSDGLFKLTTLPGVVQELRVTPANGRSRSLLLQPECGPSLPRVVVGKGSLTLDYLPPVLLESPARTSPRAL
jgi:hypothetical protein